MIRHVWVAALSLVLSAVAAPATPAQNTEALLPDQSAAKAKAILQQTIEALGGQAYLGVRETDCTGRLSLFGHSGDLTGYVQFRDLWKLPDKDRTEYDKKGAIIDLFNGDKGWTLDKGGVTEASPDAIAEFQEGVKTDLDNLLRFRLNEPGLIFRYGGTDVVDLKQVDWVEVVDRERHTMRVAIDQATHLPVREVIVTRDPVTRERSEQVNYFSNYHPIGSVQTPFQIARTRDGQKVYQVFFSGCQYNTNLPDELFTRASLEKRYAEVGKKSKNKKKEKPTP